MTFGPTVVPPGGIFRYEKNGERVEGYTRDSLVSALTELRVANNKRIGNPGRDIDQHLSTIPTYSSPLSSGQLKDQPKPRTLLERVGAWLATRYSKLSTIKFVPITEASRRAAICTRCHLNKDWRTSCRSCSSALPEIERNIVIVGQNKQTPFHDRLFACQVGGHENRVAVWLDKSFLQHAKHREQDCIHCKLPAFCWLKKLHQ